MGWTKRRALRATLVCTVVAASCVPAPALQTPRPDAPPGPVNCASNAMSCSVPYPSMKYLVAEPTSDTGYQVDVPDGLISDRLIDQLGDRETFDATMNAANGFSPLTPIIFEFAENLDPESVPIDGSGVVSVVDGSGQTIPVRVEVSEWALERWGKQTILEIWPEVRFEYGSTVMATVTDALLALDGAAVSRTASVNENSPKNAVAQTSFVVRTEQNALGRTDVMAETVRQAPHPIRGVTVGPAIFGGALNVTGQVQVTDFREAGGQIPRTGELNPQQKWVDFILTLPAKPATEAGAPVVVYGHGLTIFKESIFLVADENAKKGLATVSIDMPNHGSRINNGGAIGELARPSQLYRLADLTLQGALDQLSLIRSIEEHFDEIDVFAGWWPASGADGVSDLDTSNILYQGTSMGGFLGVATLSMAPEVDAAFLQVAGAGVIDTISNSFLWILFEGVVPRGGLVGDGHAMMGAAQMLLDEGDGGLMASRLKELETPVFLTYAVNDGIVNNHASKRLSSLLELPTVGPLYGEGEIPEFPNHEIPLDGVGVSQIPTSYLNGNILVDVLTHVAFIDDIPMAQLRGWLADRNLEIQTGSLGQ